MESKAPSPAGFPPREEWEKIRLESFRSESSRELLHLGFDICIDNIAEPLLAALSEARARGEEQGAEIEHLKLQLADAMSGCCDCPMFKAEAKNCDALASCVKEQAKEIERWKKSYVDSSVAQVEQAKEIDSMAFTCNEIYAAKAALEDRVKVLEAASRLLIERQGASMSEEVFAARQALKGEA